MCNFNDINAKDIAMIVYALSKSKKIESVMFSRIGKTREESIEMYNELESLQHLGKPSCCAAVIFFHYKQKNEK